MKNFATRDQETGMSGQHRVRTQRRSAAACRAGAIATLSLPALALLWLALWAAPTFAAEYPTKPIRLVVGFPPGGAGDFIARLAAQALAEELRQSVVVDNRAGAGGIIGADIVAKAAPDGYTVLVGTTGAVSINPSLQASIPYNPATDFAAVGMIGHFQNVIVVPADSTLRSLKDLIAATKSKPGGLNYASTGVGATPHMAGEMLRVMANAQLVHVAYRGNGPAMTDLLGGRVDFMLPTLPSALSLVRAGRLRALAVTGDARAAALPEVPTVIELGYPSYRVVNWFGLLVPARTPEHAVKTLHAALGAGLAKREVQERLVAQGIEPAKASTPQQMGLFIKEEIVRWARVVKAANIKPE
jgi:tripartite-type tricarboxylate transporter receptor subunit TctC